MRNGCFTSVFYGAALKAALLKEAAPLKATFSKQTMLVLSMVLLLIPSIVQISLTPAKAADFTIQNGQTVGAQTLQDGETGIILFGGQILSAGVDAISSPALSSITVINSGNIFTTLTGINAGGSVFLTITETGQILSNGNAVEAVDYAEVSNAGNITTLGSAVFISNGDLGYFNSSGTIITLDHAVIATGDIVSFFNSGLIQSNQSGVLAEENIQSFQNSGEIAGLDFGVVTINGDIVNLTNNGTITGFTIDGVGAGNNIISLTNNGTIEGDEDGVHALNNIESLTNNGEISGANLNGVKAENDIISLTNNGIITGGDDGVDADDDITSLTNNGTITGGEDGVDAEDNIVSLVNNGTIEGLSESGVDAGSDISSLINNGTIIGAEQGIEADELTFLSNNGSITGGIDGVQTFSITTLINTGLIQGQQDGVDALTTLSSLTNTGSIIGSAGSGIFVGFGGVNDGISNLTNAGVITGNNFSVLSLGGVDTNLTLLPGSDVFATFNLGGGTNTLNVGNGLSIDHLFTTLPQNINTNGAPLIIDGTRVVVIDTTGFAAQDDMIFDLSNSIFNTLFNQINKGWNSQTATSNFSPQFSLGVIPPSDASQIENNLHMWASAFGTARRQDGNAPAADARHDLGGLMVGMDGKLNRSTRIGGFFGTSETDIDTIANQQQIEVETIFAGLYASLRDQTPDQTMTINFGITGGRTEHDGTRIVDNNRILGLQYFQSEYDGTFIAPEISISNQINMGTSILQPTLRAGYTGLFLDGFTETTNQNPAAPVTMGERDIHILHARAELAILLSSKGPESLGFLFSPYIGLEGRSLIDGEAVSASVLGQNISFTPDGAEDIAAAFAGARMNITMTENFALFAGVEGSIDTEQSHTLYAHGGMKWSF